jgi:hypothetical protein
MFGKSQNLLKNLSPNLSPKRREVWKPPFTLSVGGLCSEIFEVSYNTFKTSSKSLKTADKFVAHQDGNRYNR